MKRAFLSVARAAGLFALARRRSACAVRILCYHGLWYGDPRFPGDSMFMQPATFRRRLEILAAQRYPVVPLAAAVAALAGHGPALPPAAVVITIDDGWASTYSGMLPALAGRAMPATLYCDTAQLLAGTAPAHVVACYLEKITAAIPHHQPPADSDATAVARAHAADPSRSAEDRLTAARALADALALDLGPMLAARAFDYMTPSELAAAHAAGLDVQLHTHRHTLGDMSRDVITRAIAENRQCLAALLDRAPSAFDQFCYPSGVATAEAAQTLATLGLASSTTTVQGLAWPGAAMHLLPRLLDGENLSEIEFESELSGFGDWLRALKAMAGRVFWPSARAGAGRPYPTPVAALR